ncbi:probable translation initiation factor eIF-2B subunit epsilon [Lactuca sativa]|uniref:probable translation initiation factor eIF-2B subunit epsilon n=1 Tax=Lactuca sativa TaxID=4236 RepID=UPI000CB981FE|nr:probable translation initiation factor eIF-2B subunit epsilon [Lactuca sativa]
MVAKKGARVPLQAIVVADMLSTKLRPITLECPEVLLPLVNTPMIDYTLAWLESADVEEVFVLCCCSHSKEIINYLDKSKWEQKPNFSVTTIESQNCTSALRDVIQGDFILVSGDTVSNMMLKQALEEHKERKVKDKNGVMTMVINQSEVGTDELIMAIDPTTKELLYYEDKVDGDLKFDKSHLSVNPCLCLHNDKQDCYIDICSPQVLSLFTDNFDYQHLHGQFVKGLLVDELVLVLWFIPL